MSEICYQTRLVHIYKCLLMSYVVYIATEEDLRSVVENLHQ